MSCHGFSRSIYGMMLKGHVYKTAMAGIGLECVLMCRTDDRCQSFNFVISRHSCEFNDRTKEARPKDFVADPDRYYYTKDINRVPLGSINDLAAKSCKEIKASEPKATSGNFWLSTIKRGMVLQAYCDMKTFDVDECSASSPVCDKNGICNNTVGSYNCTCKQGYSSAEGKRCKDIDECQISSPCHVNATCRNSDGSYSCSCNYGLKGDGKTCNENLTLSSTILNKVQGKYLEQLKTFLYPVLQNAPPIKFVRCWRAQKDGWAASTFHNNCDGKGPTVTIIQVGSYIFGGYTDKSWSGSFRYVSSSKSFIYSLHNVNGYYPMKLQIKSGQEGHAIYTHTIYGPTFGSGHGIYISNNAASNQDSRFHCSSSYHFPPGYSPTSSSCNAFFAGSSAFTPTDIEVFYETTA
ncbi:PREDICTED: low-density lipoprotein receptor-related protein 4-like isoform X3 [Acropora digitifera]|uniref:low-density lipoprotein receptor-related protein 4-like isoform X3 n=2 Tax=Acropora digitifera TaxID=70779 RepID=UPI00077B13CE|nr:PREDICTED: low-density lipoprotein receptor-related protein 4-like isoform X3 [Acropora digitifera]